MAPFTEEVQVDIAEQQIRHARRLDRFASLPATVTLVDSGRGLAGRYRRWPCVC